MKKLSWHRYLLGICVIFYLLLPDNVNAEANVFDCLEDEENCNEQLERESEENNIEGNGDLLLEDASSNPSLGWQIVRLIVGLVLVLGLVYLVLKLLGKRNGFNQQTKVLRNIGGISVGANKSVQIIQVGNRFYLVGVGDNVELLQEIEDQETKEQLLDQAADESSATLPFLSKVNFDKNQRNTDESGKSFDQLLTRELASIRKNRQDLIQKHKDDKNE